MNTVCMQQLGKAWTITDLHTPELAIEAETLIRDSYEYSIQELRKQGKIAVGQPQFFIKPDPYNPLYTSVGWKQSFYEAGEFNMWLEEFQKEHASANTER